ncbi:MAG: hypothetical protein AB1646_07010 [Thermodesulfobacteriota bacterium]
MPRIPLLTAFLLIAVTLATPMAHAEGEGILALSGEYTFFLKPLPGCTPTYYQKMVPCVERICEPVPRRVVQTYPVPVPSRRRVPTLVCETPLGCAKGEGDCLKCFPPCTKRVELKECVAPRIVPTEFQDVVFERRIVCRPTMRPQWFEVNEHPMPCPPPAIKVRTPLTRHGG